MSDLHHDLRCAVRALWRRPLVTLVAVLALAVGIGANSAIGSVVHAVLLRPLAVEQPDRLFYVVLTRLDRGGFYGVPYHNVMHWREARSFRSFAAMRRRTVTLGTAEGAVRLDTSEVPASYFDTLGVEPMLGRRFNDLEAKQGAPVAVLSHVLWQRRFGADPEILERTIALDGTPHTVVGVMPPGSPSGFLGWRDLWTPLVVDEAAAQEAPLHGFSVLGRLADGVRVEEARTELDTLAARVAAELPAFNDGWGVELHPVRWWVVADVEQTLLLVLGAGLLVLLVCCATVSNLLYSRAVERRREVALRQALGAPRGRLLRLLLLESLVLAGAGAAAGLGLAWAGVELLPSLVPFELPRAGEVRVAGGVLAATLAAALAAGVACGLGPALALLRTEPEALHEGGERQGVGRRGSRARRLLVAAQTALAAVAVIGAGLLVRSMLELRAVDPGFVTESLLTLKVELPAADQPAEPEARIALFRDLLARLEALPGVVRAGASATGTPLVDARGTFELFVEGQPRGPRPDAVMSAMVVSPGYRETMRIPLVAGRWFEAGETWESGHAVVVNEAFAERYWQGEEAIGRWVEWSSGDRGTVVGVLADVHQARLHLGPSAAAYLPWGLAPATQTLVVRTAVEPHSLLPAIRRQVSELLPGAPVFAVASGEELLAGSYADRAFAARMLSLFATLALGLGLAGLYGVVAHSVAGRRREIGVRMALGALPGQILRLVVGQGLRPVLAGLAAGVGLGLALARTLESQLYAVSTRDPAAFAAGIGLILVTALAVCALPARRAARVDPAQAVRSE